MPQLKDPLGAPLAPLDALSIDLWVKFMDMSATQAHAVRVDMLSAVYIHAGD